MIGANSDGVLSEARKVLANYRAQKDGNNPGVVTLPGSTLVEFARAMGTICNKSIKQIVPFNPEGWRCESYDNVVWRLARKDKLEEVQRLYLIPLHGIDNDKIRRQMELDSEAKVLRRVLPVDEIPVGEQIIGLEGLWILDGATVAVGNDWDVQNSRPNEWRLSQLEPDLALAISTWNTLWDLAQEGPTLSARPDLQEPLVLSAGLMNDVAPSLCTSDQVDPMNCTWYHSAWQYLRILNMVSTPSWHATFYRTELRNLISSRRGGKTIITGAADYSMLAYVIQAMEESHLKGEIVVLDKCPTPLLACRWYAKRQGYEIAVVQRDVLSDLPTLQQKFDLVCTDAFLTRFTEKQAVDVAASWNKLLVKGGKLITTVRIHTGSMTSQEKEMAVLNFRRKAILGARRWYPFIGKSPEEIGQMAEVYARKITSENLGGQQQIAKVIQDRGFSITSSTPIKTDGEFQPTHYLRMVCVKTVESQN